MATDFCQLPRLSWKSHLSDSSDDQQMDVHPPSCFLHSGPRAGEQL
jgi:hypothetical protein